MPINIAQGNIKTVIHTVQKKKNTVSGNLQKIVSTLENSSVNVTFFKQRERIARVKTCHQAIAPITEVVDKLAISFSMTQGQITGLNGG